jgi:hypothetical protein
MGWMPRQRRFSDKHNFFLLIRPLFFAKATKIDKDGTNYLFLLQGDLMKFFSALLFTCLVIGIGLPVWGQPQASYIWWEGEQPSETNFPETTWFNTGAIQDSKSRLSNGDWLTIDGERRGSAAFARYSCEIPQAGDYHLWARKFWKHGPFRWRFDQGAWSEVTREISLADSVELATHLSANWVYLGKINLSQGAAVFELELTVAEGESQTAGFDCFLLTPTLFIPRGALKPDEKSGQAEEGFFSWEPPLDAFSPEARLDLRYLNEDRAGQSGFVSRDGDRLLLGDGEEVRFWGVNVSSAIAGLDSDSVRYLARSLAKRGVNMVRYHSPLFDPQNVEQLDPKKLNDLFFLIAAMKQEGIYTTLSFYFPLWFDLQPEYGIEGYDQIDNRRPFALLYFNPRMQEIHRAWLRALLTTINPHTGNTLAEEPAVALVEIINEDSFLFWTFTKNNLPPAQWTSLENLYSAWLSRRYGSVPNAFQAWGDERLEGDDPEQEHAALLEAWNMTGEAVSSAAPARRQRISDQVRFLTEQQRSYYEGTRRFIRHELGSPSLVTCSNWQVTDPRLLDSLERYTYAVGDVIDRHGYFEGEHSSPDGRHTYAVAEGQTFSNRAAVTVPEQLPLQFNQVADYPHIISEIGWTNPNLYRADFSFLASAYGSLQGVDAFYTFAIGGAFWDTDLGKFAASSPVILGNFPGYALLYRRGDLRQADPVFHEVLDPEDLYALHGSAAVTAPALDELRQADLPSEVERAEEASRVDPLAFYTGRVLRRFSGNPAEAQQTDLSPYIDREQKRIRSLTGELVWDYGDGVVRMNSPRSQGAAGFLKQAGTIELGDVKIICENPYATVLATALDDRPLADSHTILIQAMTVERPYGFRASQGAEGTITALGSYPFGVESISIKVLLSGCGGRDCRVIALDENGYPTGRPVTVQEQKDGEWVEIQLDAESVYHLVQRNDKTNGINNYKNH